MPSLKTGALFAGYLGLEMGVSSVLDAELAWVSEIDKGACKVIKHRFPGVPNIGDITTVDWASVEPVDILTGGSPCQDLSHAGKRAGMTEGTRSNLWVAMREAIAVLRPKLVIWENVRGAYSAAADSAVEPCPGCVGDGSVAHLRALGRVLGDLSDLGYDTQWHGLRAADVGAPHGRFRVFVVAYTDGGLDIASLARADQRSVPSRDGRSAVADGVAALLPTPTVSDSNGAGAHGDGGLDLRTAIGMLPTPKARDWKGAGPADLKRHDPNLSAIAGLLPTPRATDGTKGGPNQRGSSGDLMLPSAVSSLLPTPSVADSTGGHERRGGDRGEELLLKGVARAAAEGTLLPTPTAMDYKASGASGYNSGHDGTTLTDATVRQPARWGEYEPAIRRWEALTRPAPEPTKPGAKGNPKLSDEFDEWLMGLPDGWITDVPGITRNEALKACGNGVVPQQAAAAIRLMLARAEAVA